MINIEHGLINAGKTLKIKSVKPKSELRSLLTNICADKLYNVLSKNYFRMDLMSLYL